MPIVSGFTSSCLVYQSRGHSVPFDKFLNVFQLKSHRCPGFFGSIAGAIPPDTFKLFPLSHPVDEWQADTENLGNIFGGQKLH